jgi:glycosyltransferase involved in cell wall biosynthesis
MKIAFVYDALYPYINGGAEKRYYELARRLRDDHDVHFVTWRYWDDAPHESLDGITVHGVGRPGRFYGDDGRRTVREALGFATRVLPHLLRERYDVIDFCATPYLPLYAGWLASSLRGTPLVVTWHELWGEYWSSYLSDRPLVGWAARRLEAGGAALGEVAVSVSPFTAQRLAAHRPASRPARVVSNGISLSQIAAIPAASHGSDVIFAGRLIEDKQVGLLLDAVAELRARRPDLRVCIAGDGPSRGRLEAQAAALGIADRVRFTGRVSEADLIGLLKASRVLGFPSLREGFGMVVVEAQACGAVPVVVKGPHSAASELVRDGEDGLVCESTVASMASALAALLGDEARRSVMSTNARQAAAQRDWDTIAVQMEAIYEEVAGVTSAARRRVVAQP